MPLRRRVDTLSTIAKQWEKGAPNVKVAMRKTFEWAGDILEKEAKRRAPYKIGNLEFSIQKKVTSRSFRSLHLSVEAGGTVNGVNVDKYVVRMHESSYRLGPGSQAKQDADPSVMVGPKFMERALDDNIEAIEEALLEAILKEIA